MRFRFWAAALAACAALSCTQGKGIAIVVDPQSEKEASAELADYEDALRKADGYTVYRITGQVDSPDSIRATLQTLYRQGKIEGAVLIGDIPIPMIRDAQFFTSAFKMSQKRPWRESSVPSDRFYDDFDLSFEPLGRDTLLPYHYYSLTSGREVPLWSEIFTGRIHPTDTPSGSRYDKLRSYLKKAASAKRSPDRLDHVFTFTGSGSINESKQAHIDEQLALREHFPWLAAANDAFLYMDHKDYDPLKPRVKNELMRPGLDIALLHHHGDWDTQYFKVKAEDNLTLDDFGAFQPEAKLVLMDACYNGAFQMEDCIANEYIFQPGGTLVAWGGSVNVLQDKWPDEFLGLLAEGYNIGQVNQFSPYLEMHVIGDPTFHFVREKVRNSADALCLKIRKGSFSDEELLSYLEDAPSGLVRHEAFNALMRRGSRASKLAAVKTALTDNAEQVQRAAINQIPALGDPELIPVLAGVVASNNASPRIRQNAGEALQFFPREEMLQAVRTALDAQVPHTADTSYFTKVRSIAASFSGRWDEDIVSMLEGGWSEKKLLMYAGFFRLYLPPHYLVQVRSYADTCSSDAVREALKEAIEWHREAYSYPQN